MATLDKAIRIAAAAHEGQPVKGDEPYILHPLRVMMNAQTEEEKIVGVLHDVVEDCDDWTLELLLKEGFSQEIVDAIESVTKRKGEDYMEFIKRCGSNPIGRRVKFLDIQDNLNVDRLNELKEQDIARLKKYIRARRLLLSV